MTSYRVAKAVEDLKMKMIWQCSCPKSTRWIQPIFISNEMWRHYSWQAITEQVNRDNNQLDSCVSVKELSLQGLQMGRDTAV